MFRHFTEIFLFMCLPSSLMAGTFLGLQPGSSTKRATDEVLGKPAKVIIEGEVYDYSPEKYDAHRISVRFGKDTQIIEAIDLYLKERYDKSRYKDWFDLSPPDQSIISGGNLVEFYLPQGISLHYGGKDDSTPVEFFSHFDPVLFYELSGHSPEENAFLQEEPQADIPVHQGTAVKKSDEVETDEGIKTHRTGITSEPQKPESPPLLPGIKIPPKADEIRPGEDFEPDRTGIETEPRKPKSPPPLPGIRGQGGSRLPEFPFRSG